MTDQAEDGLATEASWPVDGIAVHGTLLRPAGAGPFPAVAMVAGSGPTDRDWNSPLLPGSNGSARLLAAALAKAGFASLRYDKRAAGPHARENVRALIGRLDMASHVAEFAGAVATLAAQPFVRPDRIFGLGNSEGTLHVLNYAVGAPTLPLAGIVLVAPPGRAVGAVARAQLAAQAAAIPGGDGLMALYDDAIARFMAGVHVAPPSALPQGVQDLLNSLASPANLPFARELWLADATTPLRRLSIPALVLIGHKDIQVDWQADGDPLQAAAAGRDVIFAFPPDANHVLKHEPRPPAALNAADAMAAYNSASAELDAVGVDIILRWLAARV